MRNGGDEILSIVQLEIQEVSGISTQIRSFGTIEKLEAGELRNIPVEITARADAGSGIKEIFTKVYPVLAMFICSSLTAAKASEAENSSKIVAIPILSI